MQSNKRSADEVHQPQVAAGSTQPTSDEPASKVARLADDRVARLPVGANLVEIDGKSCTHEVAWPPGQEGSTLPPPKKPGPPAREYPFKIDPFQQTAVNCLEAGHSVLVAAHTSAGKTVVAEYAFAMALRDKTRVVYTSPLKALSNQKYRELAEEFVDVGLMTGDVTINPNASCLVMTTEILRSMLYRGSEVVREVSLLVYDEIHYLRDAERGVVWEESIILAPKSARFVFLSATIPNAREFADWVAKTHDSPCHVVYTDYRPTPLQHYIFPAGGDGLYMVVDEKGTFREDNFQKAVACLTGSAADGKGPGGKGKAGAAGGKGDAANGKAEKSDIFKIVKMIMERNYDPVIIFSFSKRECEALASNMAALDLTDEDEKKLIDSIYWNAMDCLSADDQRLPQITALLPMLKRGIGVHHSGLLPICKEVVEILFQEGLLKALFATETFSTGLNMPAKTVVFTNVRKFDGGVFRWVSSGEYIQMSGRAGRRGLDDRGIVILMLDQKMEPPLAKEMIKGAPDTLNSAFHLGYNMLLNLMRVEGADPEQLMARSFRQFQVERSLPHLEAKVDALKAQRDAVQIAEEAAVTQVLELMEQLAGLRDELRAALNAPQVALPFLQPGRLVRVLPHQYNPARPIPDLSPESQASEQSAASNSGSAQSNSPLDLVPDGTWGAVVNMERVGKNGEGGGGKKKASQFIVDVLVNTASDRGGGPKSDVHLLPPSQKGMPQVVTFSLTQVSALSSVRIYLAKDLRPAEARQTGMQVVAAAIDRLQSQMGKVPLLDPQTDMKLEDKSVKKLQSKIESLEKLLSQHMLASAPDLRMRLGLAQHKHTLDAAVQAAKREAKAARSLILKDELKARQRVLRRLQYVNDESVVTIKGRVAADIATGDELVLAEMIFNGAFNELTHEQIAAVCSCFVWREKSEQGPKLREDLLGSLAAVKEAARRVAKVAVECKMPSLGAGSSTDVEEYVESFRPDLMEPLAAWTRGMRFADVIKMTSVFEGSLVRAVRREEELLRQLNEALMSIGELGLAAKIEETRNKIKRDIIFAASLYL